MGRTKSWTLALTLCLGAAAPLRAGDYDSVFARLASAYASGEPIERLLPAADVAPEGERSREAPGVRYPAP